MIDLRLRYGTNRVPVLSNNEIDRQAEAFIADYDPNLLKKPGALDVEDFAENYIGLRMHYTSLSHKGFIWGRMVFRNTKIIVYNPADDCAGEEAVDGNTIVIENRLLDETKVHAFRSTVMHECGHFIYHCVYYSAAYDLNVKARRSWVTHLPYTTCREKNIIGQRGRLETALDWIEHQAKYFSAAVLMPRSVMIEVCRDTYMRYGILENYPGRENEELAVRIAKAFNVSTDSALIRIRQLGLGFRTKSCNRSGIAPSMYA